MGEVLYLLLFFHAVSSATLIWKVWWLICENPMSGMDPIQHFSYSFPSWVLLMCSFCEGFSSCFCNSEIWFLDAFLLSICVLYLGRDMLHVEKFECHYKNFALYCLQLICSSGFEKMNSSRFLG